MYAISYIYRNYNEQVILIDLNRGESHFRLKASVST